MNFLEKWLKAVEKKNSVLCAGLDPAEFNMGRKEKGLPENADKRKWAWSYVNAVAPYCAAIKPNFQYWKDTGNIYTLFEITRLAHLSGMVVIDDSKLADIGSTNDAGIFYSAKREADAVTIAPYAGNMAEAADQAKKRGIGVITMCLMSNPEYEVEKNKLVDVSGLIKEHPGIEDDLTGDIKLIDGVPHVKQYLSLACKANVYGLDGIVIGAPSEKNHITKDELSNVFEYSNENTLVLLPGVGAQGGEADIIWNYFGADRVIVNVGRSLMFPSGSESSPAEQTETAKNYQEMLNELRLLRTD